MKCPQCQSEVPDSADRCFECGHVLRTQRALIRGSVIASRFEILAPLGKGGMGIVYKARDRKLEEVVAIKVLRPEVGADPEMERRFRKEIRLARQVRHRNVCGIHEYGDDGDLRFITMEYIEGVDLRRLVLETGGLPVEEAFDTCIRTAEGLQAIHEAGIVHRDLKTANLMRDSQGVVRLMDFGIAKEVNAEGGTATATGLVMGTPEYMSPEQARAGPVDHRTDIYALGIVAFELFTGRVPFRGETPLDTILKQLEEPPPLEGKGAEAIPPAVVPVLRKALAKEPDQRFASAALFATAITQARDETGVAPLARRPSPSGRAAGASPGMAGGGAPLSPPSSSLPTLETLEPSPTMSGPGLMGGPVTLTQLAARPDRSAAAPPFAKARRPDAIAGKRRGAGLAILSVAALLGLGAVLVRLRDPSVPMPAPTPAAVQTASPSPTTVPPLASPTGTLVVEAVPWGEVIEVVDATGRRQELGGGRYTPIALALPPGTYTVRVRRPGVSEPRTGVATVRAAAVETVSVVFRRVDAQDYLEKTGY